MFRIEPILSLHGQRKPLLANPYYQCLLNDVLSWLFLSIQILRDMSGNGGVCNKSIFRYEYLSCFCC